VGAMILPQTAEYALRAMACLALAPDDTLVRSAELAAGAKIPSHYVSKVMRRLVLAGLVRSQRGHGGGFSLARTASDISFMDILIAVDFDVESGKCAFGRGDCDANNPCALHPAWTQLKTRFSDWALSTTLDSVHEGGRSAGPGEAS
jgi:Rrf2 family iron-sulfur cluster assembly transcriptional regulator